jgi:hypothetical protein
MSVKRGKGAVKTRTGAVPQQKFPPKHSDSERQGSRRFVALRQLFRAPSHERLERVPGREAIGGGWHWPGVE